jgi:hypothetical protein
MATLTTMPARRQEQIELQVAVISPLLWVKGHSSPEAKVATERARVLIEQAEALGEPPENPLLLYSVLFGTWVANAAAINGDALLTLAAQFLALAEKQGATAPLVIGHSIMGFSLFMTGSFVQSRRHYDHAIALYDPAAHRPLLRLFGNDMLVGSLSIRSLALWSLGYPEAAISDANFSLGEARDMGDAAGLLFSLFFGAVTHFLCGNYATTETLANELYTLADEQGAVLWKSIGQQYLGYVLAVTGRASEAAQLLPRRSPHSIQRDQQG